MWNCFFEDARNAVNSSGMHETTFADDLNCWRYYNKNVNNEHIKEDLKGCQNTLHAWGEANRVQFDAAKESHHVLHRYEHEGEDFRILGILFDCQLRMCAHVHELAASAGWKLRTLLRGQKVLHGSRNGHGI